HRIEHAARGILLVVGEADREIGRRDRARSRVTLLHPYALILAVREENRPRARQKSAAAILIGARTDRKSRGSHVARNAVRALANEHAAALFRGTLFDPEQIASV